MPIVGIPATCSFAQRPTDTVIEIVTGRVKHRLNANTLIHGHSVWPSRNATSGCPPLSKSTSRARTKQRSEEICLCLRRCMHCRSYRAYIGAETDRHGQTGTGAQSRQKYTCGMPFPYTNTRVKKGRLRPAECGNNRHSGAPAGG